MRFNFTVRSDYILYIVLMCVCVFACLLFLSSSLFQFQQEKCGKYNISAVLYDHGLLRLFRAAE